MIRIEYDGQKVNVPESWDDITVGRYEAWGLDKAVTAREKVEYVAKICQTDPRVLLEWPAEVFDRIVDFIGFVFDTTPAEPCAWAEIDGVRYVVNVEQKLTTGEWVDADSVQTEGKAIISNILAIVCRPVGEVYDADRNEARQAMFAAQPVSRIRGVLAFFLLCKTVYDKRTEAFSKLTEACAQLPPSIGPLLNRGGGIKLSQTWRIIRYFVLMKLLYFRLRRYLRSWSTCGIRTRRIRRKGSWTLL